MHSLEDHHTESVVQ